MANYYESARTNYFRVKDEAAFKAFMDTVPGCKSCGEGHGTFCVLFTDETVPNIRYLDEPTEAGEDYEEFDFMEELAPHLADGSIAILVAAGNEKMRYVCGYAIAIDNTGKTVNVNINDIYAKAKKSFGDNAEITRAEY